MFEFLGVAHPRQFLGPARLVFAESPSPPPLFHVHVAIMSRPDDEANEAAGSREAFLG